MLEGTIRDFTFSGVLLNKDGRARVYEVTIVTAVTIRDLKENKSFTTTRILSFVILLSSLPIRARSLTKRTRRLSVWPEHLPNLPCPRL